MVTSVVDLSAMFDFTLNPYVFLSLIALLVNLGIVITIITRGYQNQANAYFVYLMLVISLWSLAETLSRASATPEAASFWNMVGAPGWVFISVLFFSFVVASVGKEEVLYSWTFKVLTLGPAFLFLALTWLTDLINYHEASYFVFEPWGWVSPSGPLFSAFLVWLEFYFVAGFAMLIAYTLRTKDVLRRKQMGMVVIGGLVPVVGGSLTDGFLPTFGISVPGMSVLLTTVLGAVLAFGILRYKLFVVSPTTAVPVIINTMNEALVVANPSKIIEFVNSSTLNLLGYKKEELVGENVSKLFPEGKSTTDFDQKVLNPLKEGVSVTRYETEFITKSGSKIPINFSASSLATQTGEITGIVGVATDAREVKRFITDLTAERNKLSTALAGINDGVFVLDRSGKIVYQNPAAERLIGQQFAEVSGRSFDETVLLSDKEGSITSAELLPKGTLDRDKVTYEKQNLRLVLKNGANLFVNLISAGIKEGSEVGLGAIVLLHDVTREKELEEMKLDFVSMAAHELRTPITSVRGYLSVLMEDLRGKLNKEELSFINKAFISSSQLSALVENLLSVSLLERGTLKLEIKKTIWSDVLQTNVENFQQQAKEKNIKLILTMPKKALPKIEVDQFRISEVLANLIGNALNYTRSGGTVEISAEKNKDKVVTSVRDTGEGIPTEAIPKLFTKFFRVSGVLEQGSKGTGLGLYISKAIVGMHKGRIWVESKLGVGSTFSFSLPIKSDTEPSRSGVAFYPRRLV